MQPVVSLDFRWMSTPVCLIAWVMGPQDQTMSIFVLTERKKTFPTERHGSFLQNHMEPQVMRWNPKSWRWNPKSCGFVSDDFPLSIGRFLVSAVPFIFRGNTHDSPKKRTPPHHLDVFQCFFSAEISGHHVTLHVLHSGAMYLHQCATSQQRIVTGHQHLCGWRKFSRLRGTSAWKKWKEMEKEHLYTPPKPNIEAENNALEKYLYSMCTYIYIYAWQFCEGDFFGMVTRCMNLIWI